MTILAALQSASVRLIGRKPATFFSSTAKFEVELVNLANEVAKSIADGHDWQGLMKTHLIAGDGVTTAFPLPADYDRQLLDSNIYDASNWAWGYRRVVRYDEFLYLQVRNFTMITPGWWILMDDQIQFLPAPGPDAQAKFLYISKNIATDENGSEKASFTADGDTFFIDERLLTLGIIWRWREQKRLDYASDQANFDQLFSHLSNRDSGAAPIFTTGRRWPGMRFRGAYPWSLGSL